MVYDGNERRIWTYLAMISSPGAWYEDEVKWAARCRNIFKASFTRYNIHVERNSFRSTLSMPSLAFDMELGGCFLVFLQVLAPYYHFTMSF